MVTCATNLNRRMKAVKVLNLCTIALIAVLAIAPDAGAAPNGNGWGYANKPNGPGPNGNAWGYWRNGPGANRGSVPIPATVVLFGAGLGGFAAWRALHNRHKK